MLERSHYDAALYAFAIRNVANYSPPVFERDPETLDEWEILLRLTAIAPGAGADAPLGAVDDFVAAELAGAPCGPRRRRSRAAIRTS